MAGTLFHFPSEVQWTVLVLISQYDKLAVTHKGAAQGESTVGKVATPVIIGAFVQGTGGCKSHKGKCMGHNLSGFEGF